MARDSNTPTASVVILSDFASGTERGWDDLRFTLAGLAKQDIDEPIEYLLVETEELRGSVPEDLARILPSLRVAFTPARNSYELRNDGVREARCELVGTLDADCVPDPDWVRVMVEALRRNPEVAAVSGRTFYAGTGFRSRAAALLERSYIEEGTRVRMRHIANNGAGFRRSLYLAHPLPIDLGIFASQVQSEAMMEAGHELMFEPRMRVTHQFYAAFDSDHRAGAGYGAIRIRMDDHRPVHARLARLGYLSLPIFFFGRLLKQCLQAVRYRRVYGVRWYELPGVFVLAVAGSLMEVPGMLRAVRGEPPPHTSFR